MVLRRPDREIWLLVQDCSGAKPSWDSLMSMPGDFLNSVFCAHSSWTGAFSIVHSQYIKFRIFNIYSGEKIGSLCTFDTFHDCSFENGNSCLVLKTNNLWIEQCWTFLRTARQIQLRQWLASGLTVTCGPCKCWKLCNFEKETKA